jgi:uncharacterized protein involved in response to NO
MSAAAGFALWPKAAALHALGAGGVATMILAVMSRAVLGHTGRTLVASELTTAGYVLVTLGAAGRVIASILESETQTMLTIVGFVWAAGFALYVVAYAPMLCRPRIDGRPG